MAIDYSKLRTPFFEIKIGGAQAGPTRIKVIKNKKEEIVDSPEWVILPMSLLRLVESIEVYEVLFTPEYDDFAKIVIKFVTGSREPLPIGPYATNTELALSNNSSSLLDILMPTRAVSNTTKYPIRNVKAEVTDNGKIKTEIYDVSTAPKYLFQERNAVEVTFGYKELPTSYNRVATGYIAIVQSEFPESGSPRITLTCQMRSFVDQMNPVLPPKLGIILRENNTAHVKDVDIHSLIKNLWEGLGGLLDKDHLILSENLNINTLENNLTLSWPKTESVDQFIKKLASWNYAYYDIIPHPIDKKPVLIFIKKADFESGLMLNAPNLFNYKAPGSIIKSINLKVDFAISAANTQMLVDQNGNFGSVTSFTGKEQQSLAKTNDPNTDDNLKGVQSFPYEEFISLDPANGVNPIPFCAQISSYLDNKHSNRVEYHPGRSSAQFADPYSSVRAATMANAVQMEIVTIGHPKLTPGLIHLNGLGTRYSGKYRVLSVSHIIDSNGYICRAQAVSHALSKGGIEILDTANKSSNTAPNTESTTSTASNAGPPIGSILEKYLKTIRLESKL
jgi:hypothetical protein